ncbi:MAG: hypothetical protein ACOYJ0_08515, partial [Eubacterium sp.]
YSVLRFLSKFENKRTEWNFITIPSHFKDFRLKLSGSMKNHGIEQGNNFPLLHLLNTEVQVMQKSPPLITLLIPERNASFRLLFRACVFLALSVEMV